MGGSSGTWAGAGGLASGAASVSGFDGTPWTAASAGAENASSRAATSSGSSSAGGPPRGDLGSGPFGSVIRPEGVFVGTGFAASARAASAGSLTWTLMGPDRRAGGGVGAGAFGAAEGFSSSMSPNRSSDVRSLSSSFGSLRPVPM